MCLGSFCGLAWGNPQEPGNLGLSSKSKLSRSNFLVDLKEQYAQCDEQRTVQMYKPIVELKNC